MTVFRKTARIRPFDGESAASLISRASALLSPAPATIVAALLGRETYLASAAHSASAVGILADFLGISESDVAKTMVSRREDGNVGLGPFSLRADQIAFGQRRTYPRRFADFSEPHDKLVWCIRALNVDPDTGYPLISACPNCAGEMLWCDTRDLDRCAASSARLSKACVSHYPDTGYSQSFAKLFASEESIRIRERRKLPAEMETWTEADILSFVDCLAALEARLNQVDAWCRSTAIKSVFGGRAAIADRISRALEFYRTGSPRTATAIAFARVNLIIRRCATQRAAGSLLDLLGKIK
jgi:hypothetical protein